MIIVVTIQQQMTIDEYLRSPSQVQITENVFEIQITKNANRKIVSRDGLNI